MKKLFASMSIVGLMIGVGVRQPVRAYAQVIMTMQDPIPAPSPPGEHRLPAGQWCSPPVEGQPRPLHPCACHRVVIDEMCEGTPMEDRVCLTYCKMDQCRCPVHCEIPPETAPGGQPGESPEEASQVHVHD